MPDVATRIAKIFLVVWAERCGSVRVGGGYAQPCRCLRAYMCTCTCTCACMCTCARMGARMGAHRHHERELAG